jgi:hypothetical protein
MPGPIKLFRTIPQTLEQSFTTITGGLPSRTTASISFTLAAGAEGQDVITLAPAFTIFSISVGGKKCRVRLYSTSAFRAADATRGITVPPTPGTKHGCILDLYLNQVSQQDPWTCSPAADGFNQDTPISSVAYIAVKNFDSVSQTINTIFTYVPIEALAS